MSRADSGLYNFGPFRVDAQKRLLWRGDDCVPLTPKAFDVLCVLIQNHGQVIGKEQLLQAVWPDSYVEESNLTQTVFMLRKALAETPDQRYILTVQGKGYRFAADVVKVSSEQLTTSAELPEGRSARESTPPERLGGRVLWNQRSRLWVAAGCGAVLVIAAALLF